MKRRELITLLAGTAGCSRRARSSRRYQWLVSLIARAIGGSLRSAKA
jgi:hypothetical protein